MREHRQSTWEGWKKIGKKLLFPPGWGILLLVIVSVTALVTVFVKGMEEHPVAYAVYVLSFYMVLVLSFFFAFRLPSWVRDMKEKVYNNPLGNRYMTDAVFKVRVSLHFALGINIFYAIFKFASGVYFESAWWAAVAVYYFVLAVIRFLLLRYVRQQGDMLAEYKSYRLCGILLLLVNLILSLMILLMIVKERGQHYPEAIVIASATYTFYTVGASIKDLIVYRKKKSPVLMAAKFVRFGAALVSLLTLEVTMLATFGEGAAFHKIMIQMSGLGVSVLLLAMSIYMIHRAGEQIRKLKTNNQE